MTLSEFKIEISNANLPAGTAVTYVITNNGKITHEMVLEKASIADEPLEFNGVGQEAEDIEPGTTRSVEWTIPDAGGYQLACHVPGHYEAGMKTLFTTAAIAGTSAAAPSQAAGAAAPQAAPAAPLPKTGANESWWPVALGLLGLLCVAGALALRFKQS